MNTELFSFVPEDDSSAEPATAPEIAPERTSDPELTGEWEAYLPRLQARYPGNKDGTLFCVWKIEQDRDVAFRDLRAEAELRGIALSGRSMHSARVLLGLEAPTRRRTRRESGQDVDADVASGLEPVAESPPDPDPRPRRRTRIAAPAPSNLGDEFEQVLQDAIDAAARSRTESLRGAIRDAIEILRNALDTD